MKRFLPSLLALAALFGAIALSAADGPMAYWPLDGDPSDASGNENPLLDPYKKQAYAAGLIGKAATFDPEQRNFVRSPNGSRLDFSGDFTVGGWVKIPAPAGSVTYGIFRRFESEGGGQFDVEFEGRNVVAILSTDGTNMLRLPSANPLPPDEWTHVVLGYDGKAKTARLWLTPHSENAPSSPAERPLDAPLHCPGKAEFVVGHGMGSHFLQGAMDELVMFNRALTPQEIAALFKSGKEGKPAVSR